MSNARDRAEKRQQALTRFMDHYGLQAASWCRSAGLSPNTLYKFLRNEADSLSWATLDRLSAACGRPIAEIVGEIPPGSTGEGGRVRVDEDLLAAVLDSVERRLDQAGRTLAPHLKARVVALLYQRFADADEPVDARTVADYLKLVVNQ